MLAACKAKTSRGCETYKSWANLLPELRKRCSLQSGHGRVKWQNGILFCTVFLASGWSCFLAYVFSYPGCSERAGSCSEKPPSQVGNQGLNLCFEAWILPGRIPRSRRMGCLSMVGFEGEAVCLAVQPLSGVRVHVATGLGG